MEITPDGTPEQAQDIEITQPETPVVVPEYEAPAPAPIDVVSTPVATAKPDLNADPEDKLPESPVAQNALIERLKEDNQIQARLDALAGTEDPTAHDYTECNVGDLVTFQAPQADNYDWRREDNNFAVRSEIAVINKPRLSVSFHVPGEYAYSVLADQVRKFFHVTVK